jgi:hypothetical protein
MARICEDLGEKLGFQVSTQPCLGKAPYMTFWCDPLAILTI